MGDVHNLTADDQDSDELDDTEESPEVVFANTLLDPLEYAGIAGISKELMLFTPTHKDKSDSSAKQIASQYELRHYKVEELPKHLFQWAFALLKRNMREMYAHSAWGWNERSKRDEMSEVPARYLVVFQRNDNEEVPVAFTHFRFDMDYCKSVLYCYELHLEESMRGLGLGTHIMRTLEQIATKTKLEKVVLTVFKSNVSAVRFFQEHVGYVVDETNPLESEDKDYLILSKSTPTLK